MEQESVETQGPQIKIVLKALNHVNRRDILLYLKDLRREVSFSELMDYLQINTKSSSQFSYHLKLLLDADLISKISEKYTITTLGMKASSMLDLVDIKEPEIKSVSQKIYDSFRELTTIQLLILSFSPISFILFFVPLSLLMQNGISYSFLLMPTLLGGISIVLVFTYAFYKLKYIPSILVLTNVIWIVFLPANQIKFGIIYFASLLGTTFFYQFMIKFFSINQADILNLIIGIIFFVIAIFIVFNLLYEEKKLEKINSNMIE